MKKLIICIFSLFIVAMCETSLAQIVGKDQNPRRDTIKKDNRTPRRDTDTIYRRRDTSRTDTARTRMHRDMQHGTDTGRIGRKVDSAARALGRKGSELGAKAVAGIKDRSLKYVKGPGGETVYVDKYDRRYYINKEGRKVYLKKPKSQQ